MAFKKRKSVKKMGKKWLGLASFFLSVDGVVVDSRLCLLESLIIPGFFGSDDEIGETTEEDTLQPAKGPQLMVAMKEKASSVICHSRKLGAFWYLYWAHVGLVFSRKGAVAQPWMFISGQGKPGHPFAVLPVTAASWCSSAFACVYVLLPQDIPAGFFLTEKAASVKISKWLFGAVGVGRISGKKAVLTRTRSSRDSGCFFHSCLLNLESLLLFCYSGRAVNATLAFFPKHV